MATTKPPSASFNPEIPRRVVDIPGNPRRRPSDSELPGSGRESDRKLLVGRDISLSGEINSCDHLIVEGRIEAMLKDCRSIDVAEGGVFKGSAEIDDADIAGRFEGDLSVKGRLKVRGTGVISGNVRYGQLEVEAGGQLIGNLQPLDSVVTPIIEQPAYTIAPQREEAD